MPPDDAVAHGLFSRHQDRAAGYRPAAIELRIRSGGWMRCGRGLLRLSGRLDRPGDALLLAVLRAGPAAVASHRSAAVALGWELLDRPDAHEVIAPRGCKPPVATGTRLGPVAAEPARAGGLDGAPLHRRRPAPAPGCRRRDGAGGAGRLRQLSNCPQLPTSR